jgi:hypothetical protein
MQISIVPQKDRYRYAETMQIDLHIRELQQMALLNRGMNFGSRDVKFWM